MPDAATTPTDPTPAQEKPRRKFLRRREHARWFHGTRKKYPNLEPVFRWGIATIGVLLIVVGIVISWLPGPGGFVAFIGIAMLASEFRWARKVTRQAQAIGHRWHVRVTGRKPKWAWRAKKKFATSSTTATA